MSLVFACSRPGDGGVCTPHGPLSIYMSVGVKSKQNRQHMMCITRMLQRPAAAVTPAMSPEQMLPPRPLSHLPAPSFHACISACHPASPEVPTLSRSFCSQTGPSVVSDDERQQSFWKFLSSVTLAFCFCHCGLRKLWAMALSVFFVFFFKSDQELSQLEKLFVLSEISLILN